MRSRGRAVSRCLRTCSLRAQGADFAAGVAVARARGGLTTLSRGVARSTRTSARKTSFRHRGWEQRTSVP